MTRHWVHGLTFIALLLLFSFVSLSCGNLTKSSANAAFRRANPTFTLIHSDTGEGWDGVINYHFSYRKPDDTTIYKEVWTLERRENRLWEVTGRWTPKE